MRQMGILKKLGSAISGRGTRDKAQDIPTQEANSGVKSVKTFTHSIGSDIQDDSMNIEIYRGESQGYAELGVSILWDDKYEIQPPEGSRTYSAEEVTELLELVVPFVVETVKSNLIDRVAYPQYHEKVYRGPTK